MMVGLARREPETECAKRYETLRREFGSLGLDANAVIADVRKHVYLRNGRLVLDEAVYLPTGLVLGMPLPDELADQACGLLDGVTKRAGLRAGSAPADIVTVPRSRWHVTLFSKTHYDHSGSLAYMTPGDLSRAHEVIRQAGAEPVRIVFSGIIVTRSGKVIVPGYPTGPAFFRLREALATALCACQIPQGYTAHLKLAHITSPLSATTVQLLRNCVDDSIGNSLGEFRFTHAVGSSGNSVPLTGADATARPAGPWKEGRIQ